MDYFADVLIIGAGGSGLSLAIKLKKSGVSNIAIISKISIMSSHTSAAKGGINASLSSISEDKPEWHIFDTLKSANHMAEKERVEFMCMQAPEEIAFLEEEGVRFDRLPNGKIDQRRYGGQKTHFGCGDFAYRSCFSADRTGLEIMKNLHASVSKLEIRSFEFHFVYDISKNTVFALDLNSGKFVRFTFKILVFAGGGFSQNYITNSSSNALTGDCQVLALKAGGSLEDIEFVQFHPTGLFKSGILISEAVRAEGGYLLNNKGERFMSKYSPDFMELAPRDVVARAIFIEGEGFKPAFLSLRHLDSQLVLNKLKGTIQTAKFFAGIDVFRHDIPVFPTAHYNMGGIKVDSEYRMKDNIFAIGECAGARIHGANRLGCNSLLELFTSSTCAFRAIMRDLPNINSIERQAEFPQNYSENLISFDALFEIKQKLAKIMQEKCGVLREEVKMQNALSEVSEIYKDLCNRSPFINSLFFSNEFVFYHEIKNLLTLSAKVLESAIARRESRGSHLRVDYPNINPDLSRF